LFTPRRQHIPHLAFASRAQDGEVFRLARSANRNIAKYWWDKHTPGLSLMRADFTSHDYPSHTHDAFVIAATELGGARVRSRGTVGTIFSDTLFEALTGAIVPTEE